MVRLVRRDWGLFFKENERVGSDYFRVAITSNNPAMGGGNYSRGAIGKTR